MQVLCGHTNGNSQEMVPTNRTRNCHLLETTLEIVYALVPRSEKVRDPLSRLASIKQGSNETLKVYVRRFNKELATIHNPQENGVLMEAILGIQPETPFWDKLQKDDCKTLLEF